MLCHKLPIEGNGLIKTFEVIGSQFCIFSFPLRLAPLGGYNLGSKEQF
jgi:hypothetical protein